MDAHFCDFMHPYVVCSKEMLKLDKHSRFPLVSVHPCLLRYACLCKKKCGSPDSSVNKAPDAVDEIQLGAAIVLKQINAQSPGFVHPTHLQADIGNAQPDMPPDLA